MLTICMIWFSSEYKPVPHPLCMDHVVLLFFVQAVPQNLRLPPMNNAKIRPLLYIWQNISNADILYGFFFGSRANGELLFNGTHYRIWTIKASANKNAILVFAFWNGPSTCNLEWLFMVHLFLTTYHSQDISDVKCWCWSGLGNLEKLDPWFRRGSVDSVMISSRFRHDSARIPLWFHQCSIMIRMQK